MMNGYNISAVKAIPYITNNRGVFYNSHQSQYSSKKQAILNQHKQEKISRTLILLGAAIVLIFCLFFCIVQFSKGSMATAQASESNSVSYVSREVLSGDNLWSIAKDNKSSTMTTKQYMKEIIDLNQLISNDLQTGKYLLLPIYNKN